MHSWYVLFIALYIYIYITNILLDYNKANEGPGHNERRMCMLNTNTYGNPARTEMTDTDTEDRGVHRGVKGAASTYVLCPHLTDGAFQFKRGRERQEKSGERE